ncbi:MAG: DMT family transporter [Chitinophagaceae bacterium]|nr:MAG: DMT family transporter [Chitinophagaceae bacterium]
MNNNNPLNWLLFILLSFIWGSSFILMKAGMMGLSAFQVASIRIISAGIVLLPVAIMSIRLIPKKQMFLVFMSGALGSLIPAYLFCVAEQKVDSALAGVLNSLTPIFVIIAGAMFFNARIAANKVIGILIALSGSVLLFLFQPNFSNNSNVIHISYIILATALYGYNVNMVHKHLKHIPSIRIAAVALMLNAIPAFVVLFLTGYFSKDILSQEILIATGYSAILGIFGTAVATILFYMLLKRAGSIFASMVTYGIPIVAIFWGIIYNEEVGWKQVLGMAVILIGVFVANKRAREIAPVINE